MTDPGRRRRRPPSYDVDIPPDRADGSSSFVHRALIVTARIGRVPPLWLLPVWIALTTAAALPWAGARATVALIYAILLAADWLQLALLPHAGRSWGPITPSLLGLALVRLVLFLLARWLGSGAASPWIALAMGVLLTALALYATWIEPFRIRTTEQDLAHAALTSERPIRALQISDIHFEGDSPRERALLNLIRAERPDLLFLTGDYLNLSSVYDPAAQQGARRLLQRLDARRGIYAVTGSPPVDVPGVVPEVFAGLPIRWLLDEAEAVDIDGQALWILGVRHTYDEGRDGRALTELAAKTPQNSLRILLYHTPDLMPVAARLGIDLYLCGHTHGGQIRLPFYGALATSSRWGKRYEQGRYVEGQTTLFVSRGLGVEGLGAPRARFLAPPEVVAWRIAATAH
ncbi:MAG: hypothetical protein MUF84_06210 [Anaerolineae bacterium]|nr:hypothetical protein [Anaerolineae bacterium]